MERAHVNGTDLAYEVTGSQDPAAEPLLLVHGGIVADALAPLASEPVLRERYRLVRYHRRGYGQSAQAAGALSVADQAADAIALLRHLGLERAHVVGYSYGGTIALQAALDDPARVGSLVLLEPVIPGAMLNAATVQHFMETVNAAFALFSRGDKETALDTFARGAFGAEYRGALERALPGAFAQAVADTDVQFQSEFPSLQGWTFSRAEAGRLRQPVLSVLHQDPAWAGFQETHDALRQWLPPTETLLVPVASHLLPMVAPRAVAEGVAAFLARHPLPAPRVAA